MSRIDSRVSISRFASQSSAASNAQLTIDAGLHSFSREASNPVNLIPMASASFAYQFGRSALTAMGAGRILSNVLAFGMEVSALRGTSCLLSPSGESFLNRESFLRSALDLSVFKLSGHFLRSGNFFGRHGIQAFAMMGAEDLGSLAGMVDHSTATSAERFAHAFTTSIQLEVGAFLTGVATGHALKTVERSLESSRNLRDVSQQSVQGINAQARTLSMSNETYRISEDARPIPFEVRALFPAFARDTQRIRNMLGRAAHIPDIDLGVFMHNLRIMAKGRGSQFAINQAEAAIRFSQSANPRIQQVGIQQALAIAEDTIRDYHDSSVDLPYFEPAKPAEHVKSADHVVDLAPNHPGFLDPDYRARRDEIALIARGYEPHTLRAGADYGDIPLAPYIAKEHAFWRYINELLEPLHRAHACREYLEARRLFQVRTDEIPQLRDLSKRLREMTGFQLIPVDGLVTTRDFLGTLALKLFLSTQYVRHYSRPGYTPEPDISHEVTGHAAFLANPQMAELARLFGEATQRASTASDEEIDRLGNLYWHTIEYGILLEDGVPKAYGAGHLGSAGELPEVAVRPHIVFDADILHLMEHSPYDPTRMQPYYFAAPSFDGLVELLGNHLRRWPSKAIVSSNSAIDFDLSSVSSRPQQSRVIIGVTGKDASGKDSVLEMLAAQGFRTMSLSDALRAQLRADGKEPSRENCRTLANELRARDGASALARLAISQMEAGVNYAFGSIRNPAEVEALREAGLGHFHFIATTAPAELRFERLNSRGRLGDAATLEAFLAHEALEAGSTDPNAQQMDQVISMADHQIDNSGTLDQFRTNVSSYLDRLRQAR